MSFMPGKSILLRDVRKALRRLIEDDDSLRSGLGDSYWPLLYDELCALDAHPERGRADSPDPPGQYPPPEGRW
jgi:hypothetical protein